MKFILLLTILITFSFSVIAKDHCLKGCEKIDDKDKRFACYEKEENCFDQKYIDLFKIYEKKGLSGNQKVKFHNDLQHEIQTLNKIISRAQLRRAMFKKLVEKSKQLIVTYE